MSNETYDALVLLIDGTKVTQKKRDTATEKLNGDSEQTYQLLIQLTSGMENHSAIKAVDTMRERLAEYVKCDDKKQKLPPSMQKVFTLVCGSLQAVKDKRKSQRDGTEWTHSLASIARFNNQTIDDQKCDGFRTLWTAWNVSEEDYLDEQLALMYKEQSAETRIANKRELLGYKQAQAA